VRKVIQWPPPRWHQVVVPWSIMTNDKARNPNTILDWVDQQPGGNYHLHGWKATEGFAFRFERKEDALVFKLKWI